MDVENMLRKGIEERDNRIRELLKEKKYGAQVQTAGSGKPSSGDPLTDFLDSLTEK